MKVIFLILTVVSLLFGAYSRDARGFVYDNQTDLTWQDESTISSENWDGAITYCENLGLGNTNNWRLPNVNELYMITDLTKASGSLISNVFEHTANNYWSSTTHIAEDIISAWNIDFGNGTVYRKFKTDEIYVRCVRTGQISAVTPSLSVEDVTVSEGVGTATFTVSLDVVSAFDIYFDVATADTTASAGSDYTAVSVTNTSIPAGDLTATFDVTIIDDSTYEGDETFTFSISSPDGATIDDGEAIGTILENDSVPSSGSIQFSSATYSVNENGTSITITATRTGGSYGAAAITYATSNGSATAGSDYTAASGTLNWISDESVNKTFTVFITNDSTYEGDENLNLTLSSVSGATLGSPATAILTIVEDDSAPVLPEGDLQFSQANYPITESSGSVLVTVTRTGGSNGAVSICYGTTNSGSATSGSDFTPTSGILNWADGDIANKTFTVDIIDDGNDEGAETIGLELTECDAEAPRLRAIGANDTATITILAHNAPQAVAIPLFDSTGRMAVILLFALLSLLYMRQRKAGF